MDNRSERVDRFAVDHDVELDQFVCAVSGVFVIHAAVAAGDGFQFVVEVDQDFMHRNRGGDHDMGAVDAFRFRAHAALLHHQIHDVADVVVGRHDVRGNERFFDAVDLRRVGQMHRVVDFEHGAVCQIDMVDDARVGRDDVHIVFAAQTFLNDLHVEQAEEAASEAESESGGGFRLIGERGVVELKFRHAETKLVVIRRVDRVDAAEDHGFDFLEARERLRAGILDLRHRVADSRFGRALDVRNDVSDGAGGEFRRCRH